MKTFIQTLALQVCLFYMGTQQTKTFYETAIIFKMDANSVEDQNAMFFIEIQSIYIDESNQQVTEIDGSFIINKNNLNDNLWNMNIDISILNTKEARNVYLKEPNILTKLRIEHLALNTFKIVTDQEFPKYFIPISENYQTLNPLADIDASQVGVKFELIKNQEQIANFSSLYLQSKVDSQTQIPDALSGIIAVDVNQNFLLCIVTETQEDDEEI